MKFAFLGVVGVYPWLMASQDSPSADPRVLRTRKEVLEAATTLLFEEGLDAVSHRHVAQASGYSRVTIYSHWPTRADLLVDAFAPFAEIYHPEATGDPRTDLRNDLIEFRRIMREYRVDRALGLLADLSTTVPELRAIRERVATEGEKMVRQALAGRLSGLQVDAAAHMLVGLFLNSALLHGEVPSEELIEAAIDLLLPPAG